METKPIFVKVPHAARLLGLSRSKTYELVQAGVIPSRRFDSAILIPRVWIEREAALAMNEGEAADPQPQQGRAKARVNR